MNAITTRQVIVHYHIFKNAGSTIDHILENNFGNAWATFDGAQAHSRISPAELEDFIRNHPDVKALSSHNAILPVPEIPNISVFPIFFLRHPIDRVRSIYDFERRQGLTSGPVSLGAEHAAKLSFNDYLQWRFDSIKNGVTHNYQTAWLLHNNRFRQFEIKQQDFDQASKMLASLPFFGLVERFDDSIMLLSAYLQKLGIKLDMAYRVMNSSQHREKPLEERIENMRKEVGNDTFDKIISRNQWDLKLYDIAHEMFEERLSKLS